MLMALRVGLLCLALALPYATASRDGASPSDSAKAVDISHRSCDTYDATSIKNVAIIGAGASGASAAYYLSLFKGDQPVNITIFERNDYIGGRTTTVNAFGDPTAALELGGSIFVAVNEILVNATRTFNLSTGGRDDAKTTDAKYELGIWDGTSWRFLLPAKTSPSDLLKLLWRYGFSYWRANSLKNSVVSAFLKLYQAPHFPFHSLGSAAKSVGLTEALSLYGKDILSKYGVSDAYATDLIQAATRVNYAQNLDQIHGLETMVCLAADGTGRSIDGGNWQIFASMIEASNANLRLETSVSSIARDKHGKFSIKSHRTGSGASDTTTHTTEEATKFDAVILAAPYQYADLTITPPLATKPRKIDYVSLHVTLFTSPHKVSSAPFSGSDGATIEPPLSILTTLPGQQTGGRAPLAFNSISQLRRVFNPRSSPPRAEFAYKIFSPRPLNASFVADLMGFPLPRGVGAGAPLSKLAALDEGGGDVSWLHEKTWNSYPYLPPRDTFDGPALGRGVWYTSGMESFISTMETSALSGRNVAKLVAQEWEKEAVACGAERDGAVYNGVEEQVRLGASSKSEL